MTATDGKSSISRPSWSVDVWGSSSTDVYVLDLYDGLHHYNGSVWLMSSRIMISTISLACGEAAVTTSHAVGLNGGIVHYDGTDWRQDDYDSVVDNLQDVWGSE